MIPIILSILIPGLGQFYYGKNGRAVLMLIIGITPLYPIALIWSVIDVIRLNKQEIPPKFSRKDAIWAIVILAVFVPAFSILVFSGVLSVGQWVSNNYLKPKATIEEGKNIAFAIHKYHKVSGKFPADIETLIEGIPIHSGWKTDSWGEPYIYEIQNDGKKFKFLSKGKDRTIGTGDDIVFK